MRLHHALFMVLLLSPLGANALDAAGAQSKAAAASTNAVETILNSADTAKATLDARQQFIAQMEAQHKSYLEAMMSGLPTKAMEGMSAGLNSATQNRAPMFSSRQNINSSRSNSMSSATTGIYRSSGSGTLRSPSAYTGNTTGVR